jgi:protoheme IX farnesyltransferase
MRILTGLARLVKIRVVMLSTLSAVTGFILGWGGFSIRLVFFTSGIFLLAAGSAALNQYQEYLQDRLMDRTRHRPLSAGLWAPRVGLAVSILLLVSGLFILYSGFGFIPAGLGLVTVIFYNGIYTYLKRITAFAAVPGALIGTLPPAIGWTAAGGSISDATLLGLMLFFYLWQVPHFWLLLGVHSGDYAKAGFPSLGDVFTPCQLARITFSWIAAAACAGLMLPLFGMLNHGISLMILLCLTVWLSWRALPLLTKQHPLRIVPVFRQAFRNINVFALLMMVILIIDQGALS